MHNGARGACGDRGTFEILDVARAVARETRHLAVILDADDEFAARGVRERAYVLGDFLVVFAGAFAVEVLAFLRRR